MTQQIRPLSPELTTALVSLGGRKLVLVEGPDDVDVLETWYLERLPELLFFPAGGYSEVESRLQELSVLRQDVSVYGIRDRDFHEDAYVQNALDNPNSRLFLLRRYSIENYLLEPAALYVEMRTFLGELCPVNDVPTVTAHLLSLCQRLKTLVAVNWVLIEHGKTKLSSGHEILDRQSFVNEVASRLSCSVADADQLLLAKEQLIAPRLTTLEDAQTCTSGKHLMHHVYMWITQTRRGLVKDHLFRLLLNRIKDSVGIHQEIRTIVEQRILNGS